MPTFNPVLEAPFIFMFQNILHHLLRFLFNLPGSGFFKRLNKRSRTVPYLPSTVLAECLKFTNNHCRMRQCIVMMQKSWIIFSIIRAFSRKLNTWLMWLWRIIVLTIFLPIVIEEICKKKRKRHHNVALWQKLSQFCSFSIATEVWQWHRISTLNNILYSMFDRLG